MTVDWIREGLQEKHKTRSGLAQALGRSPSAVTDLLNGSRRLRAEEIAIVADYLGVEPPRLVGGGRPRASDRARAARRLCRRRRDRAFLRRRAGAVRRGAGARRREVRTRSRCRSAAIRSGPCSTTGWFFTTTFTIPRAIRWWAACASAALSDGRVLVKALKRGQVAGLWTLLSNTEPPIYDVALDWAAIVREMRPR